MEDGRTGEAAAIEEALKNLQPEDRELVREVLDKLPVEQAIEMLRYFGGL